MENYTRVILTVLGTLRLTRLVTEDWLGHWWFVQPARRWAMYGTKLYHSPGYVIDQEWHESEPTTWRQKLVKGLDCPFCVGFWLGVLILLAQVVAGRVPALKSVVRFALTALSLNYIVGHVSSRIDG